MARARKTRRKATKAVCKKVGKHYRKVKILASGKWRFVKGKCR